MKLTKLRISIRLKFYILSLCVACIAIGITASYSFWTHHRGIELNDPSVSIIEGKFMSKGRPYSGNVFGRHRNGNIAMRGHYVDGEKEGIQEQYHFNGQLVERLQYHHGQKDGVQQGWYAEGPPRYQSFYKDGILQGKYVEWHKNSQLFREQTFQDGVEVAQKIFYENGTTYSNYVTTHNRIYGEKSSALCQDKKKDGEK